MEVWKEIKGFENYEVSNLGNIKSLSRYVNSKFGSIKLVKGRILKQSVLNTGYKYVSLMDEGRKETKTVHQLVAIAFLNHIPCGFKYVVNHKDHNRLNNNSDNLEIVTVRVNTNQKHLKSSSKYTGVSWNKRDKKWQSNIHFNGKTKHLGYFDNEIDASNAYQKELITLI